jgi:methylated-DNA-[protein]-cysteine S-methyltransferase
MEDELTTALRAGGGSPVARASSRAAARLGPEAEREGLIDVASATVDSPLGPLLVLATERGLLMLSYTDTSVDAKLARIAARVSPRILEAPARLDGVRRELDEYFEGRRRRFEIAIDWSLISGYARTVLERTSEIPYGTAMTYAEVSAEAGNPRGARATGNALGSNPIPVVIPCHRVLRTGGALGGYTGGLDRKRFLLDLENRGVGEPEALTRPAGPRSG